MHKGNETMTFTTRITKAMAKGVTVELFPTEERRIYHAWIKVADVCRVPVFYKEFYAPNDEEASQVAMRICTHESNDYAERSAKAYADKLFSA